MKPVLILFAFAALTWAQPQTPGPCSTPGAHYPCTVVTDSNGSANLPGSLSAGTTLSTVAVNGVTRAVKYSTSAGVVSRLDVLLDAAVADYGDPAVVGSIAWAIGQLPATGGAVHVGAGTFPVGQELTVSKSNVRIEGEGVGTTWLTVKDSTNPTSVIHYSAPTTQIYFLSIANLSIEGNKANNATAGPCIWATQAGSGAAKDMHIEGVEVIHCKGSGLQIDAGWGTYVKRFITEYNDGSGISQTSGSQGYFDTVFTAYNTINGAILACAACNISNLTAYQNVQSGLSAASTSSNYSNIRLWDNSAGSSTYNSFVVGGSGNTFANVTVSQTSVSHYAAYLTGNNNLFTNLAIAGAGLEDLHILAGATANVFENLQFSTMTDLGTGTLLDSHPRAATTVSGLKTCTASTWSATQVGKGATGAVTDATAPTYLGTLTGSGAVYTPVICNGTAWVAY